MKYTAFSGAPVCRTPFAWTTTGEKRNRFMTYADLSDSLNLLRVVNKVQPDEIYNIGAQSHVGVVLISLNIPRTSTHSGRSEF